MEVFKEDEHKMHDILGYGISRLPAAVGEHFCSIPLFRPRGSSTEYLEEWYIGGGLRFGDPVKSLTCQSRNAYLSLSSGAVELKVSVVHQGFCLQGITSSMMLR